MDWKNFLNHQTKSVTQAGGILAVSAFLSRALGVVRDWLLAQTFGAGPALDVYFTAFKIPDFVYNILILGGVLVSFLPIFSESFSQDPKKAWRFASNCLNVFMVLLVGLSLLLFIFTPWLLDLIAPGFSAQQKGSAVLITRIMFLSPVFFGLSAIFSGILQYFDRFLVYSLCPILYNLGIIFGILFLAPSLGILGVSLGVVLGAFLHFIIQVPSAIQCGFSWQSVLDFADQKIKKVFLLMIPRTFGVSANQINLIAMNAIASTLAEGSISVFNFANNIQYFPIGIIGTSFAMASFPALSKKWAARDKRRFSLQVSRIFRQIIYLVIPVSVLIFILRKEIVTVLLRHGEFSSLSARLTSAGLALFCLGIFASSLIPLLFRAFFSLKDTKTPTLIAVFSVTINILLSIFFTDLLGGPQGNWLKTMMQNTFGFSSDVPVGVLGMPLAVSLSSIVQFALLFVFLKKKVRLLSVRGILYSVAKILLASLFFGILSMMVLGIVSSCLAPLNLVNAALRILVVSLVGGIAYLLTTSWLGSPEMQGIKRFLSAKFSGR